MKRLLTIIFFLLFAFNIYSQYQVDAKIVEPEMVTLPSSEQSGGRFVTSIAENGKYFKVLIVFVQFKDDNWNSNWSEWGKDQAPTNWMGSNTIDQTVYQNSTNNNLTHYFSVMSMGHFKIIGNFYHKITTNTRDEYISMGYQRGKINRQILEEMYNSGFNFSSYDNWAKNGEYNNQWGADNEIDMIFMVYRNISEDKSDPAYTAWQLGFGSKSWDNYTHTYKYSKWSGEASLGGLWGTNRYLTVNNGKQIDLGSYGMVSGISIMTGYNGLNSVRNVIIHEFGHHLLGGMDAHLQPGVWGIMAGYGSRSQMVSSYERHKLGWKSFQEYDFNPFLPVAIGDYLTTGDALRIKIPGTAKEYYLLENHQRVSPFDNIDRTTDGKGIYVLYQSYDKDGNIYFYNAEGRWDWDFDHYGTHPNGQTVPVFKRWVSTPTGHFDTESIPYLDPNTGENKSSSIEAYVDFYSGIDVYEPLFKGDGKDVMKPNYVEVFSPWSNPSLQNVSFQVINENNQLKIIQKVEPETIEELPPSKPQNLSIAWYSNHPKLTWYTNLEPDITTYKIWKYAEGSAMIAATVTNNPNNSTQSWIDYDVTRSHIKFSGFLFKYKVKAVDNTNKESIYSNEVSIFGNGAIWKIGAEGNGNSISTYKLFSNFPNPFNPSTNIEFQIPKDSFVNLIVYNSLGQKIKTLVNSNLSTGKYNVEFNADNLPSGLYIYKLQAGEFSSVKKMMLIK